MSEILSQLNEKQREAAACTEGPVMIIAGAGSGKTRTLTYRIAHLIEKGVDAFHILALTFTNKAANEMKERITKLVGGEARNIWMGTFHSVFTRILRAEASRLGFNSNFTIYDNDDSKSAIAHIIKEKGLDPKQYNKNYVLSRISMAKSNLIGAEDYANNAEIQAEDRTARKPEIGAIYKIYQQRLRNAMAMDFDDLLFNTNILLRDCPDVLLKYQNRFRYIMVDEYQDTNFAQYLIVKKLAARLQNICVVGDDAQSIYAFRGANIQNIFNFKRDYPQMHLFKLEQNYRSTQVIVNAANSIIAKNKEQIKKEIWTDNAPGTPIRLLRAADERDEAQQISDQILDAHLGDENHAFSDFAVLYRNNNQSRAIEDALRRRNIPYHIYSGISFYGRQEVKDVLSYLRLVVNNHDDESLVRIINKPARGIGGTTLDKIRLAAADNDISIFTVIENLPSFGLAINGPTQQRIADFATMIKMFSAMQFDLDAYSLARKVVLASGLIKALREDDDPENANRIENIEELLNGIQEFCEMDDEITPGEVDESPSEGEATKPKTLDLFLQQVLLMTSEDKSKDTSEKVSLMTIHAAKGLEFPIVFVAGMEENLFPSMMSISSRQDLEEERRLFYVAVTRAEQRLFLSHALMRYQYGNASCQEVSRFVEEIDPRFIEMRGKRSAFPRPGQTPRTPFASFGGQVASSDPEPLKKRTTVDRTRLRKIEQQPKGPAISNTPAEINAIQQGMRVSHAKFGMGTVVHIEGAGMDRKALVHFDQFGEKQMLLRFAKLTIVE